MHRDLKTSNLLYSNEGVMKVCDFGLARKQTRSAVYTNWVVTLWYRAPELLLGTKNYSEKIDIWSIGCIFAELILREPLMAGKNEMDQLACIFRVLGNPTDERFPAWKDLKYAGKVALNKKHNKSQLRMKFPLKSLSDEDPMFLSNEGHDLMQQMFAYDASKRISAAEALKHPWFQEDPKPATEMPSFAHSVTNEISRDELKRKRKRSLDEKQIA
jgi:cell division cycle 2-like protein